MRTSHVAIAAVLVLAGAVVIIDGLSDRNGAAVAVRVQQSGIDCRIRVVDDSGFVIDHPAGRSGPEWFVVNAPSDGAALDIRLMPKDTRTPADGHCTVTTESISRSSRSFKALRHLTEAGRLVAEADTLGILGGGEEAGERMRDAVEAYDKARRVGAAELSDLATYLRAETFYRIFELPAALDELGRLPEGTCSTRPYCYKADWLRARIAFDQDDYKGAAESLTPLIKELADLHSGDRAADLDRAEMMVVRAFARALTGENRESARSELREAKALADQYDDNLVRGNALNNFGGLSAMDWRYDEAESHLLASVAALENASDRRALAFTLGNLSAVYTFTADYRSALMAAERGLDVAEGGYDPAAEVSAYDSLRRVYEILGDWDRVEHYAKHALAVDQKSDRMWREQFASSRLGTARRMQGDPTEALERHEAAARYYKTQEHARYLLPEIYEDIALDLVALDRPAQALESINEALAMRDGTKGLVPLSGLTTTKGRVLLELNEFEAANEVLQEAEALYESKNYYVPQFAAVLHLRMLALAGMGQRDEAIGAGRAAIQVIEDIRSQLESQRLGPVWTSQTYDIVGDYVALLLEEYYRSGDTGSAAAAFFAFNRGRAAGLAQQRAIDAADLAEQSSGEIRPLRQALAVAGLRRASAISMGELEFDRANEEYYKRWEQYEKALAPFAVTAPPPPPSPEQIAAQLPDDGALVTYACIRSGACHAFIITRAGFSAIALGDFDDMVSAAEAARAALEDTSQFRPGSLQELGRQVLAQVLPPTARHVFVIADYPLNTVPLSTLDLDANPQVYAPMVERHTLTMLPSAQAFLDDSIGLTEGNAYAFQHDILIFADPVFSKEALADLNGPGSGDGNSLRGDWADELERLPYSLVEAESLRSLFQEDRALVFLAEKATKANLLGPESRAARILHIASHAFFDPRVPDLVGIAATPDSASTPASGFVTIHELLVDNFLAELVVISGCQTGRGANMRGEGIMSLARGFMARGVDTVVATHWPVADKPSARFMRSFYEGLVLNTLTPAEALQAAQLELRANGYPHPFYWGAYVLEAAAATPRPVDVPSRLAAQTGAAGH